MSYNFTFTLRGYKMSGIDEKNGWSIAHWPHTHDDEWTDLALDRIAMCNHKWVDTGMIRTFCKECDADGDYDPMTGKVTVVFRNKKENK
jgi:hypothetical protein